MTTTTEHGGATGWRLDELGARGYEANLVPAVLDGWAADLVADVAPRPGDRVLDLACGTAVVGRHVAKAVGPDGHVIGVDANPAMLTVAREVTAALATPTTWHHALAESLPLDDASVDVVLCQQGVQFFEGPSSALAEAARVLTPGGRLGIGVCRPLGRQPGYLVLVDVLRRHLGEHAATVIASPYALGDTAELRALLARAGLVDMHARIVVTPFRIPSARALLAVETASSPLGDLTVSLSADRLEPLLDDLAAGLAAHRDDDGLLFPFETLVVTARRP